jgi:ATP-dependent exoDNAse (exonuclease V) beta subunit
VHVLFQRYVQGWKLDEAIADVIKSDRTIDDQRVQLLQQEWKKAEGDETMRQFRSMQLEWAIEQPILMSNAKELRPDLFAWSKERDKIWLVDFKTGKVNEQHEQQILGYARVISEICKAPVQSALLYTQEMKWKNC